MSNRISVLMTVYNEADFIDYALRACVPYVDHLVIVEGAYQETIQLGANPRSTDGTIEKIKNLESSENSIENINNKNVYVIEANEQTDKDQRNVGLELIKELNPDGWLWIIDGDEVYDQNTINMVKIAANTMDKQGKLAAYFKSLTFVNDAYHYTEQEFPRLFKITPKCTFTNDNFMYWEDKGINWFSPYIIRIPYISYYHYAFCKGKRFELKQQWWNTRFGKNVDFEYDWYRDQNGQIYSPNHQIFEFTKKHPDIMNDHPLIKRG